MTAKEDALLAKMAEALRNNPAEVGHISGRVWANEIRLERWLATEAGPALAAYDAHLAESAKAERRTYWTHEGSHDGLSYPSLFEHATQADAEASELHQRGGWTLVRVEEIRTVIADEPPREHTESCLRTQQYNQACTCSAGGGR